MTKEQLSKITKRIDLLDSLNECLVMYDISSPLRVCHFLAQVLHESGGFVYFKEIASGSAYEGRKDLGNVSPGDGVKYKGRGVIQITGRANYVELTKDFGVDFINQPTLLEGTKYGILSAGWFWNKRKLNLLADKDDIKGITKKINGGLNGYDDRLKWYNKLKNIIK